jgi:hypothetical protein
MVVLAQLVRASACGVEGHRFEPDIPPQNTHGVVSINGKMCPTVNREDWVRVPATPKNTDVAQRQSGGLQNRRSGFRNSPSVLKKMHSLIGVTSWLQPSTLSGVLRLAEGSNPYGCAKV